MTMKLKRNQPLRPSKIGHFLNCPLCYVFETERPNLLRLNPNPFVYLGISFHNSIEKFWGDHLISPKEIRSWIKEEFLKQAKKESINVTNWTLEKRNDISPITQSLLNDATRLAYQQIRSSPPSSPIAIERNTTYEYKSARVEQRIVNDDIDVAGRADLIEIAKNKVTVVDFKLGLSISENGDPDPVYVMQLATYALALEAENSDKEFTLELRSPKRIISINFNRQLKEEVSKLIKRMREVLPRDIELNEADLSNPGEHCKKCSYRPSCNSYIERMNKQGPKAFNFISEFDVCGQINSVKFEEDLYSLEVIESVSKNKVQILRIPDLLINEEPRKGELIYFFDLNTPEVVGKGNFIANFEVVNSQDMSNSAFSFVLKRESNNLI